jgi:hypothetical protein
LQLFAAEALRDLTAYLLGRHLPQAWNATPSSRRCHFWIFASLLHQLFALFDRWRKQENLATPLIPRQQPGQQLAGLSAAIYDRYSQTSSSLLQEVQNWRIKGRAITSTQCTIVCNMIHRPTSSTAIRNQLGLTARGSNHPMPRMPTTISHRCLHRHLSTNSLLRPTNTSLLRPTHL